MRLNFLENPQQRIASGKRLPTRPLECLLAYGTPEHQQKAVKKILGAAFSLSQHKETHHVLLTLCQHGGSTARVELLFALRRRLGDMARGRHGNYVLQELIATLPKQQQREVAREFTKEIESYSMHPFGSRVIAKLLSTPSAAEEVLDAFKPLIAALAGHSVGQHVVAAALSHNNDLCEEAGEVLTTGEACEALLTNPEVPEGVALSALLRSPATPWTVKDAIGERLTGALLSELISGAAQTTVLRAAVEFCSPPVRATLVRELMNHLSDLIDSKQLVHVAVAMLRVGASVDPSIPSQILASVGDVVEAAKHPTRTLIVRAWIEGGAETAPKAEVKKGHGKRKSGGPSSVEPSHDPPMEALAAAAAALSEVPAASPVVQLLCRLGGTHVRETIFAALRDHLERFITHPNASFVVQALMDPSARPSPDSGVTSAVAHQDAVVAAVLEPSTLVARAKDPVGSRTVQHAFGFASPELLCKCAQACLDAPGDEGAEPGVRSVALDRYGSFALSALLQELCRRGPEVLATKRAVMAALKPMVFSLALSPWAGRVVLECMLANSSKELREAIRRVVYLKAENWLSEAPAATIGETEATKAGAKSRKPRRAPEAEAADSKPKHTTRRIDVDRAYLRAASSGDRPARKRQRSGDEE